MLLILMHVIMLIHMLILIIPQANHCLFFSSLFFFCYLFLFFTQEPVVMGGLGSHLQLGDQPPDLGVLAMPETRGGTESI